MCPNSLTHLLGGRPHCTLPAFPQVAQILAIKTSLQFSSFLPLSVSLCLSLSWSSGNPYPKNPDLPPFLAVSLCDWELKTTQDGHLVEAPQSAHLPICPKPPHSSHSLSGWPCLPLVTTQGLTPKVTPLFLKPLLLG